jgi:hypothetical protein
VTPNSNTIDSSSRSCTSGWIVFRAGTSSRKLKMALNRSSRGIEELLPDGNSVTKRAVLSAGRLLERSAKLAEKAE